VPVSTPAPGSPGRREELSGNLAAVRARIAAACDAAGRGHGEVTLIAVTKTFPVSDVLLLRELGVTEAGENKDQEASAKAAEVALLGLALNWHFVGQLQVNKCASVARYASVVHSVDRLRLAAALGSRARASGRELTCLVQVSLDGDSSRGGAAPADVPALADAVAAQDGLRLGGVMAVAPLRTAAAAAFGQLGGIAQRVRQAHPAATIISAGMSGDLEQAIMAGATHVRIGTALLGGRPAFVR